jgi:hypothetical protein
MVVECHTIIYSAQGQRSGTMLRPQIDVHSKQLVLCLIVPGVSVSGAHTKRWCRRIAGAWTATAGVPCMLRSRKPLNQRL